jgi:ABC-2 type transport system permease protein/sodium transport system permease protein
MTPAPPPTPLPAALARIGRLVRKELSEILRDRRTILTLVLMPVLLYPLLSMAFQQLFLSAATAEPVQEYVVGCATAQEKDFLEKYLHFGTRESLFQAGAAVGLAAPPGPGPAAAIAPLLTSHTGQPPPWKSVGKTAPPYLTCIVVIDPEEAVRAGAVHLGVRITLPRGPQNRRQGLALDAELYYLDTPASAAALRLFEEHVAMSNAVFLQERLRGLDVPQRATPMRLYPSAIGKAEPAAAVAPAALVPLILILMTITGAVYPAIDLTAGERERGTLEILVAAPVPRLALLFAKYVAVVTVALLTAVVNLVMMFLTLQLSGLSKLLFPDGGPGAGVVAAVFALLVLFALFFSAMLLVLTSFARSFKEAQAYLIPLMLVALAPGVAALLPGTELTGPLTVVPLLNIVLLARDLLQGKADALLASVVVTSTLLYAAAAIAAAARVFGAEAVLYSEQSNWADLFRRPLLARAAAPVSAALLCLALMFPLMFVCKNLIGRLAADAPESERLGLLVGLVAAASVVLFGLLPLGSAALGHVRLTTGFRLLRPPWAALAGGLLLGVALWPLEFESLALLRDWRLTALSPERFREELEQMRKLRAAYPAALLAAAFALTAVAEEWFFRGYLFAALRAAAGPRTTVVVSALLFGLFHFIMDGFAPERLLPSTALGFVLGWVAYRSGSVLPGMVLHACHNSALIVVGYSDLASQDHIPLPWLLGAAVVVAAGGALIWLCRPPPQP